MIDNSPSIMTGIGVVGTVATGYLAYKAGVKSERILRADHYRREVEGDKNPYTAVEKIKRVWPEFIPPVTTGAITVAAVIGANKVGSRRAAAVAAAYSLSEKAYTEYKEKVVQRLGDTKEQKVRDEIAVERMTATPVSQQTVIMSTGDVLCCDSMSMRYFMSSMENIKKAQNDLNDTILRYNYATLSDFYDNLDIPKTAISDEVGWNTDNLMRLAFTSALSDDGRPCLYIEYAVKPIRKYATLQ